MILKGWPIVPSFEYHGGSMFFLLVLFVLSSMGADIDSDAISSEESTPSVPEETLHRWG